MASKRATDVGEKLTRLIMAEFPELAKSHDDDIADILVALGALAGGILAGVAIRHGQVGVDAAFFRFQMCVRANMNGTIAMTKQFYNAMREQREKGPKGKN